MVSKSEQKNRVSYCQIYWIETMKNNRLMNRTVIVTSMHQMICIRSKIQRRTKGRQEWILLTHFPYRLRRSWFGSKKGSNRGFTLKHYAIKLMGRFVPSWKKVVVVLLSWFYWIYSFVRRDLHTSTTTKL